MDCLWHNYYIDYPWVLFNVDFLDVVGHWIDY